MSAADRQAHWQNVYTTKGENEVSWFQERPSISLQFIESAWGGLDAAIVDIGGGASRLVDALLEAGNCNLTVLDLSEAALAASQKRIGPRAASVKWLTADVTT
jgi:ubiquinone/menaquinone biosynthesis C-methylase UbiE